jgi:hypothetical protein
MVAMSHPREVADRLGRTASRRMGAPTAGPPPYEVYEVIPKTAFGFSTDLSFGPTRWDFGA